MTDQCLLLGVKRTCAPRSQQLRLHNSGRDLATNEFAARQLEGGHGEEAEENAEETQKITQKITVEVEASSRAAAVTKLRRIMAKAGVTKKSKIGQTVLIRRA